MADDKNESESLLERAAKKISADVPRKPASSASAQPAPQASGIIDPTVEKPVQKAAAKEGRRSKRGEMDLKRLRDMGFIMPDSAPTIAAEEFRLIKRSLILNAFAKGDAAIKNGNLILVTSCRPGEGKTYCAINLALSIALEQDITVLLVDADFSKPEVLSILGMQGGKGLVDAVADPEVDLGDCLIRTNIDNFSVLPAGRQHNRTPELLASDRMSRIMQEIAYRYPDRIVIFDSPPVLASSAGSVMALQVGQVAFVIEAEKTTEPQIKEALTMISACKNINLILNKTRFSGAETKFGSYYGYSNRS